MRKRAQPAEADTDQLRKDVLGQPETNGISDAGQQRTQGDLETCWTTKPSEGSRSNPEAGAKRPDGMRSEVTRIGDQPVPEDEEPRQLGA